MARKKYTPFAVQGDTLYVDVKAIGIHFLIVISGELGNLTRFPDEGTKSQRERMYVTVDAAIEWHSKELAETKGRSGNQKALDALREAKRKFIAGLCSEND